MHVDPDAAELIEATLHLPQCGVDMRQNGQCAQKEAGIENLDMYVQFIHVSQAGFDVFHFAAFSRSIMADVSSFGKNPAADLPELITVTLARACAATIFEYHYPWSKLSVRFIEKLPGPLRLDYVSVRIDDFHTFPFVAAIDYAQPPLF